MENTPINAMEFHCPRWGELPSLSLYMDQVLIVIEEAVAPLCDRGEPVVKPTMINNYVKQRLIGAPTKKKYDREHIALLIVVSVLKRALSIPEIDSLIRLLVDEYGIQAAYDLFCDGLEEVLRAAYGRKAITWPAPDMGVGGALNAALTAWIGKWMVRQLLAQN